jgi:hypothetical protein
MLALKITGQADNVGETPAALQKPQFSIALLLVTSIKNYCMHLLVNLCKRNTCHQEWQQSHPQTN